MAQEGIFGALPGGRPTASPQSGGKRRAVSQEAAAEGKDNTNKLVLRSLEVALSGIRRSEGVNFRTFIIPKGDSLAESLKDTMNAFNDAKPSSGPHPWRGSKHPIAAALLLHCSRGLEADATALTHAQTAWKNVDQLCINMKAACIAVSAKHFHPMTALVDYAETRDTKDGRRLLRIRVTTGRVHDVFWAPYSMVGQLATDLVDPLLTLLGPWEQDGPGPKGPLERELDKLIRAKK